MRDKTKVVITSGYRWSYFQWFLLGFYELEKKGDISLHFSLPPSSFCLSKFSSNLLLKIADKLRRTFETDSYNMDGYIEYIHNGKREKKYFTVDSADAPYLFDERKLKSVNCYFKMQCPLSFEEEGFKLTDSIVIPWCDHAHVNSKLKLTERGERKKIARLDSCKIKPLLNATRSLGKGISYNDLKSGYKNYIKDRRINKEKKIMCYFGNSLGPKAEKNPIPDFDWEGDIMGYFGDKVCHPNEKRAKIADILNQMEDTDSRIISNANADSDNEKKLPEIPLKDFCAHVAKFEYNINVSGYRMSIPSRFIESMMVGTAIVTDQLKVRWFLPFDEEVVEISEMGYLPDYKINWRKVKSDLENLKDSNPQKIVKRYEDKWAPIKVAEYMIKTIKEI